MELIYLNLRKILLSSALSLGMLVSAAPVLATSSSSEVIVKSDEYDYDRNTISVVLYDSIRPNLYGVFWNGIPLQKDGELLDIDLTVDTYVGYPSCLQ